MSKADIPSRIHFHLVSTPDIAPYTVTPDGLRARFGPMLEARGVPLTVTEDLQGYKVTPELLAANIVVGFMLPHREMRGARDLAWIHMISAGIDHLLPLDWLPRGTILTNSSGVHSELAGEYAAAAVNMINIGVPRHATNQRSGKWDQTYNMPLRGKTVVLVGVGAIGGAAATEFARMGLRVIGVRKRPLKHKHVHETVTPDQLLAVLPRADYLVITAALTDETRGMIGAKELDALPRGAGLVNMSRAGLVDTNALVRKLEAGHLRGAIIDVTDQEPLPPESPLWRVPDLMITPHISSDPVNYVDRMTEIVAENLGRLLDGKPLINRVSRSRGY